MNDELWQAVGEEYRRSLSKGAAGRAVRDVGIGYRLGRVQRGLQTARVNTGNLSRSAANDSIEQYIKTSKKSPASAAGHHVGMHQAKYATATGVLVGVGADRQLKKNALEEGAAAAKKAARMARPKLSAEEIERLKAARAEKIARGEAKAPPAPKVKQKPWEQRREKTVVPFFQGNQIKHLAYGVPLGVTGLVTAHQLSKSRKRDAAAVGAGAVGGSFLLDQADTVTGASLKRIGHKIRQKAGPLNETQRGILQAHQRKFGFVTPEGTPRHPVSADPHPAKNEYFRSYPNGLPGARVQRLNSMRDRVEGRPVMAAGALLGGAWAAKRIHDHNKKIAKMSDRERQGVEAGAAVAGGGAAQGAYQLAGYETKHYVDRHTRRPEKMGPGQRAQQDKLLKPLKVKYHMHPVLSPDGKRVPHPARNAKMYHRNYPKSLPYAREIRILGHTHEGKTGIAIGAATTALGAGGALAYAHHKTQVKKVYEEATMRRHKRTGAALSTAGAAIGLGTLAARGGAALAPKVFKEGEQGEKIAGAINRHTQTALIVGTGVGGAGQLNSARINRQEAKHGRLVVVAPAKKKKAVIKSAFGVEHDELEKSLAADIAAGHRAAGEVVSRRAQAIKEGQDARKGLGRLAHRVGSMSHDLARGYSHRFLTAADLKSGRYTSGATATHKTVFGIGSKARWATPYAAAGGAYYAGSKAGGHRPKQKD